MIRITPQDEHFEANLRKFLELSSQFNIQGNVAVLHIGSAAAPGIKRLWFYDGPPRHGAGDFIEVNSQRIFYGSIHEICYRIGRKEG